MIQIEILKSKIHRATVTQADINYIGSITIDEDLMKAANLIEFEKVHVLNINNGERIETYVIKGKKGSGTICLVHWSEATLEAIHLIRRERRQDGEDFRVMWLQANQLEADLGEPY